MTTMYFTTSQQPSYYYDNHVSPSYPTTAYYQPASPRRPSQATNVSVICQVPELHSTQPILPYDCSWTPRQDAPVPQPCDARVPWVLGHFFSCLLLHNLGQKFVLNDSFQPQLLYLMVSYHLPSLLVSPNHLFTAFQGRAGTDCPAGHWVCPTGNHGLQNGCPVRQCGYRTLSR